MKKIRLFLAAAAAMFSYSVSAQLTDGQVYWFQDVQTGQFLSQGANWGTQATMKDVGGLGLEAVQVSDGVYNLKNIMWNKTTNGNLGLRSVDPFLDQWLGKWTLVPSGDGYKLRAPDNNGNGTYYLSATGSTNAIGVKAIVHTTNEANATVWKVLTYAQYQQAIQTYKDNRAASIAQSMGLDGVTSVAQLENAVSTFEKADYTSKLTNPTLASNWDGWTHEAAPGSNRAQGNGIGGNNCAEFWNGCGHATQTITGLPNGLYKITFAGTFRPRGASDSEKLTSEQTSSPAFCYANDDKVELVHWIDVAAKTNNRDGFIAQKASYQNTIYTYVSDGTLKIGLVQDAWYNGNMWCPFGDFHLTFIYDLESLKKSLTGSIEQAKALEGNIPSALYANIASVLDGITPDSYSTVEDYTNAISTIANAVSANASTAIKDAFAIYLNARNIVKSLATNANSKAATLTSAIETADAQANAATTVAGIEAAATNFQFIDEGNYYFRNVGSGLYLGYGNNWGSRASLTQHADYFTAAKLSDGAYSLESRVNNGGTSYWFGGDYCDRDVPDHILIIPYNDGYVLHGTSIIKDYGVVGNAYGYDGTKILAINQDPTAANAQWAILTKEGLVAELPSATQSAPKDATFFIVDPNFTRHNRDVSAWTATSVGNMSGGNNDNNCAETFHADFTLSQVLAGVPNGVYAMTAQGFYRQDGSDNDHLPVFYANDESKTFPLKTGSENSMSNASVSFTNGLYTIDPIFFEVTDGQINLGAKLAGNTNLWCIWDNFELTYYGTDANIWTLKYPYDVQPLRDQALAKKDVENVSEGTKTNIDATVQATAAIPTTKAEYDNEIAQLNAIMAQADKDVNNKPAIDATFDVLNSTNVYTQAAYNTFKAAADDYLAKWEAGTLTEVVPNPSISGAIGWHVDNIIDDYLLSAWTIGGDQAANYDKGLYINTWSVEGDNDGTNFKVPFFEYWTGDDNSLAANTIAANVEGLEAGSLYEVSAWVRVRAKNGVAAADATGITMQVGTGTAVDATEGQVIGNSQMSLAEVIARGTADANGKLTVKLTVADDTNVSWLSFKNVNYGSLSDIYDQTLAAAQALVGTPMEDNAAAALAQTIADYGNVDQADADKVLEAIQKLRDIVAPTQASIDLYKEIAHAIEVVKDQATAEANDLAALDAPYAAGTYHAVQDVFDAYFPIEAQALTSADATDYTSMLVNPSFETGDLTGWEVPAKGADYGVRSAANDTYKMTNSDGDYLFNNWNGSVTTLNLTQTLKNLPVGNYTLTGIVAGYGDESPIIIKANGESREIKPKGADLSQAAIDGEVKNGYLFSLPVKVTTGTLAISVENTGKGATFFKADNFKLGFEPLYELALNDPGTAAFAVKDGTEDITAKKLDHESSEVTADVAAADKAANQVEVNNEKIEHGIQVTYTGVDAVNTEVFECGYRATARLTDSKGNVYQVKTRGDKNTNVINVAEGLFGPNEEYEVVITPIVYYNYDMACDDIYTYWENGKATHQVADPADESWGWDTTTDPATTTKTGVSTILDPAWTLNAAAIEWNQTVLPTLITVVGTPSTDVILFTDCDPLPYYVDYNKHVFYIKTDASVQANVKALAAQDFKAWDAWGNDITAEFLSVNGGTATGIDKVQQNTNGAIYNLAGQRVAKTQKGIYVVNGKKVAVK